MKTTARFEIGYEQLLDPDGKPMVKRLPAFANDKKTMLGLYKTMSLTRAFDTRAIALQRTGKLGTYASCLGHEATHVGVGSAMAEDDVMAPSYREYGAQFTRGVKPEQILGYWGGSERGNVYEGPAAGDFAWCVPIASQCLYSAGAALAFKTRGEKRAVVVFLGDGGTSEGAFYEGLNAAGVWDLPMVFVIVNNRWAISVPLARQTRAETLAQKGLAAGVRGVQVDGNDIIAVRKVADEALKRAREGKGPTVIEALTYRLSDHTTADDATRYREAKEVEAAQRKEPFVRTRKYLESLGIWDEKKEKALVAENKKTVDAAVKAYQEAERDSVAAMFDHMYAELPDSLREQREAALREAE
ncbi:MAG: pyruvate dehydrogenase (acetyl-transferring) E1 component subunit alpha [Gammaproteobacteria bacterium]|nr:pyruvate dehydrogenase (acetyl-transferring) E1 component subunit alpha [Gammaproteobacteria bacterium]